MLALTAGRVGFFFPQSSRNLRQVDPSNYSTPSDGALICLLPRVRADGVRRGERGVEEECGSPTADSRSAARSGAHLHGRLRAKLRAGSVASRRWKPLQDCFIASAVIFDVLVFETRVDFEFNAQRLKRNKSNAAK